jgi:deoxycytidylate deaminase
MPHQLTGGIIWVTDQPCPDCAKALAGAPIHKVVFLRPYHYHLRKESADILETAGIELVQYQPVHPGDLEAFEA